MKIFFKVILIAILVYSVSDISIAQSGNATQEQLNQAQGIVSRGERLSSRIGAMKTQAQREKDIIRVNCLNTKLGEVNANLRNAKSRLSGLRSETDPQRVTQAMTVMLVLGQKFQVLDQQANQCIGQNVFETGATKVDTEIDNSTVPTDQEVQTTTVPDVVPPSAPGVVTILAPPVLPSPPASVYTLIFKNADGETKKIYLTLSSNDEA